MPDKQPYFTVKVDVTHCAKCPNALGARCTIAKARPEKRFAENCLGITPSCPLWAQRVQQQEKQV